MSSPIRRRPAITLTRSDHTKLVALAEGLPDQNSPLAEELLHELGRARVVDDGKLRSKTVRIGSALVYRPDDGPSLSITLVSPESADISQGRVSVMTPVGAALIGLSEGQSIDWTDRGGRKHLLTVLEVTSTPHSGDIASTAADAA